MFESGDPVPSVFHFNAILVTRVALRRSIAITRIDGERTTQAGVIAY